MHEFNQAGNVSRAGWWRRVLWELQLFVSLKSLWTRTSSSSHLYIAIFPPPFSIPTPPPPLFASTSHSLHSCSWAAFKNIESKTPPPPPIVTHLLVPLTTQTWPKTIKPLPLFWTHSYMSPSSGRAPLPLCRAAPAADDRCDRSGPGSGWEPRRSWWVIHYSRLQLSFKGP